MPWIASNIIANTVDGHHHCPPKLERWPSRASRMIPTKSFRSTFDISGVALPSNSNSRRT